MNTISKELELPGAFVLGAAAVPSRIVGMNAEVSLSSGVERQDNDLAKQWPKNIYIFFNWSLEGLMSEFYSVVHVFTSMSE